ncbi:MAG: TetR/AcrR family transcriptional regulator, partial [Deltaproteobacteria bacterium]|nr:TetR/AcrR family transcriptional regulator [Deltaproteobacteria bacterium]
MTRRATSRIRPRKAPIQRRSRATVEAILGATARILVRSGWDALTTNRVAEKAGVSIGTLYEWFPSKEALVTALLEAHLARAESVLDALVLELASSARTLSLSELAARMAEAMVALHEDEPRLHRVLSEEIPQTAAARARVHTLEARMMTVLAALLASHPRVLVRDPEVAARLVVVTLEAAT